MSEPFSETAPSQESRQEQVVSGEIDTEAKGKAAERPNLALEDLQTDLRNAYRKQGEASMKVKELEEAIESVRKPGGKESPDAAKNTIALLTKLQEELNFHKSKEERFASAAKKIESDIEKFN